MAQIQQVERAQIGVEYVLGIGGFELETVDKEVSSAPPPHPPPLPPRPKVSMGPTFLSALHTLPLLCPAHILLPCCALQSPSQPPPPPPRSVCPAFIHCIFVM